MTVASALVGQTAGETPTLAEGVFSSTWLLIALPLLGAAVLLLGGRRLNRIAPVLGCVTPVAAFVLGVALFVAMVGHAPEERAFSVPLYDFFTVGDYQVTVGLLLDQLSMAFVLLITGVGSLIHVYSVGYMEHDENRQRFFGYLNLFVAAMLLLVLADDYLILYVGWEGVGLASFLLIGFWQHKDSAAVAAKKAFVVNRVGDFGMTLAILSMVVVFGTTAFSGVFPNALGASEGWLVALGLLLLLGACGKSAQFPLQSWLLDAMEGPTPVSALIHAATMVTAGVYLIVRSAAIYNGNEIAQTAVVIVGTITLLMGAIIGCAKDDIKKALAGSTMSQIGYMMLAAGLGPAGYAFAIFHLLTHGFFKADLFLGAGSVMHGMNDDVNMRHYGGLSRLMPITFYTFAAGYLAIIGFPFFAGYYSKDHIIEAAFEHNLASGLAALIGAGITGFYMTRLMMMTFVGTRRRWPEGVHPHESPAIMTVPLIVLGIGSAVSGMLLNGWIVGWLDPAVGGEEAPEATGLLYFSPMGFLTLAVVAIGAALAVRIFGPRHKVTAEQPATRSLLVRAGRQDLYGDVINEAVFMRPGQRLTADLLRLDDNGIDGTVNGTATAIGGLSAQLRRVQNGFVRTYALTMVVGAALVGVVLVLGRLG